MRTIDEVERELRREISESVFAPPEAEVGEDQPLVETPQDPVVEEEGVLPQ